MEGVSENGTLTKKNLKLQLLKPILASSAWLYHEEAICFENGLV
jgi:hypothetical protein